MAAAKRKPDDGNTLITLHVPGQAPVTASLERMKEAADQVRGARVPMKETEADVAVRVAAYSVTADELRQFIERYEHLEAEKKDITTQQKDVMSEAKGRGYDTKVMKKIIAIRKRDKNDLEEEEAILELYKSALGMA